MMHGALTIARLTWIDARRTRIALAAFIGGLVFLAVYGTAVFFMQHSVIASPRTHLPLFLRQTTLQVLTLVGLYVANFLTVATAVMLPVDCISGEIDSGVMQTVASKPVDRSGIVIGKWLGFLAMIAVYLLLVAGGVVLLVWVMTGFLQPHLSAALPLMLLSAVVMLTLSIAGGTRFSTVTNGIAVFAFYAIAFIGGWIEQIGVRLGSSASRYIGTVISLISPSDALWRRAAHELQPPLLEQLNISPFSAVAVPSGAMVVWGVGFVVVTLLAALRIFQKRAL
jgi:ABC-type transport system involved in multi-copper enzyme maturation permease subunit